MVKTVLSQNGDYSVFNRINELRKIRQNIGNNGKLPKHFRSLADDI